MSEIKYDAAADELIVFKEFSSINEAEVMKSALESVGIASMINNEYMSAFYPIGVIYPQIMIRRSDFEKAKALIKE
ncbi:MAG: DUF2007 domain-containing protein [Rikenellaceae bacterium]